MGMEKKKHVRKRKIFREIGTMVVFIVLVCAARSSVADHVQIPSGSMLPTIEIGDRVLVNKLSFGLRVPFSDIYLVEFEGPRNGDVVVCVSPEDDELLIKRVIAIPGDVVEIRMGRVRLNGKMMSVFVEGRHLWERLLATTHPVSYQHGGGPDFGPVTIPDDMYLMVGDNRGNSQDGRAFGFIPRSKVYGRALGIFWRQSRPVWKAL